MTTKACELKSEFKEKTKSRPVRMCVVCRGRFDKFALNRFGREGERLVKNNVNGRSFYICSVCLKDEKRLQKSLLKTKINIEELKRCL